MKYLFFSFAVISFTGMIIYRLLGDFVNVNICVLTLVVSTGIIAILNELKKNNKEVIVRDPKTGRFKKK